MLSKPLIGAALKPLILSLLADGPKYGFQIAYNVRVLADNQITWSNSKLYPLLHKLEHDGFVESYWEPSQTGPDRKYYRLTMGGKAELAREKQEWKTVHSMFASLWEPEFAKN